jgi:hypothetical protein
VGAETVECACDGLVRLGRQRTVRHRASREATDDRFGGLDVFDRDAGGASELQQVAQLQGRAAVDELGKAVVVTAAESVRSFLQGVDDGWTRRMRLSALAELDVAGVVELRAAAPLEEFALELGEPDASDRAGRSGQAEVDHVLRQADGFEELRAPVRRDLRNAHLGHDLEDAVLDRFAEPQLRLRR